MSNILVTGGFGFIGSHLIESLLLKPDNHVHVVDNLSSAPIDTENFLDQLPGKERLTYDISTIEEYCGQLKETPDFQQIYHLASVVGPVGILRHSGKISFQIISDTQRVIELALCCKAKIVDVSTSEIYGGGKNGFCSEEDSKIVKSEVTTRLEYAVGKLAAEISLINMTRVSPLQASIVRPFNVAGPRQSGKGGFVLPRFIDQAITGKSLTVYGDGEMIRAFTHVKDIVSGSTLVMEKGINGVAYNVGNPSNKTSILNLAKLVIKHTNSKSQISLVDPNKLYGPLFSEASNKFPNAERIISSLNWAPKYTIKDIVLDTYEYMQSEKTN